MGLINQKVKKDINGLGISQLPSDYARSKGNYYHSSSTDKKLVGYTVILQRDELQFYIQSIKKRLEYPEYLVQIQHAQVITQQIGYCKFIVYIEDIGLNLQQVMFLNFRDMVSILYFSLKGFHELFKFYNKYFTIESYMIGINDNGQVKVWVNRDYSKNQLRPSYSYLKSANIDFAEENMVKQLKQIFLCKIDIKSIPNNFSLQANTFQALILQLQARVGKPHFKNSFPHIHSSSKLNSNIQNFNLQANNHKLTTNSKTFQTGSQETRKSLLIRFNYKENNQNRLQSKGQKQVYCQKQETQKNNISKFKNNVNFSYQTRSPQNQKNVAQIRQNMNSPKQFSNVV